MDDYLLATVLKQRRLQSKKRTKLLVGLSSQLEVRMSNRGSRVLRLLNCSSVSGWRFSPLDKVACFGRSDYSLIPKGRIN